MAPILELRGITKRFPGVRANDHINLTLEKGEIHALLGENGAGKTTLMNILYGLYNQDEGEILVNGQKAEINEPTDAIRAGIGMVHQHFMLIPVFTVTENVMLGEEYTKSGGFLDRAKAAKRVREISEKYKLNVDPDAYVGDLPVGTQQRVEIIKLLFRDADVLIMDEPTAVLTPQEVKELFKIMRFLVDQGKSIIFITHNLGVIAQMADRIAIMYLGKVVETGAVNEIFNHPQHPYTTNLLKAIPTIGKTSGRRLASIQGSIPGPHEWPVGCSFHPRCKMAMKGICDIREPGVYRLSDSQEVRCFLCEKGEGK